jgi:tRNA (guanine-N7-)-methyltransferase
MTDVCPAAAAPPVATTRARKRIGTGEWNQLARLWPRFGVELDRVAALNPAVLEVGFGHGESLLASAVAHPGVAVLGVELYTRGAIQAMRALAADPAAAGARIVLADARAVAALLPAGSLRMVNVLFPDPWPKRRQRHRRLLDEPFLGLLFSRLRPGGTLHVASDWPDYLAVVETILATHPGAIPAEPPPRPPTRFETRARNDGRPVADLAWRHL